MVVVRVPFSLLNLVHYITMLTNVLIIYIDLFKFTNEMNLNTNVEQA